MCKQVFRNQFPKSLYVLKAEHRVFHTNKNQWNSLCPIITCHVKLKPFQLGHCHQSAFSLLEKMYSQMKSVCIHLLSARVGYWINGCYTVNISLMYQINWRSRSFSDWHWSQGIIWVGSVLSVAWNQIRHLIQNYEEEWRARLFMWKCKASTWINYMSFTP